MMRRAIVATVLAVSLVGSAAASTSGRWSRYRTRDGRVLIVKRACLASEDSAAHLRLRAYDGSGRVVLGCYRRGY